MRTDSRTVAVRYNPASPSSALNRMVLDTGSRVGSCEIVAAIGAGGMGEVYRSRDTRLRREVAINILPQKYAQDPERVAQVWLVPHDGKRPKKIVGTPADDRRQPLRHA
ncbi:MAG TPA: hypothetical protein VJ813_08055 [Vicinamibacterales bacterium]|nr:hypothetical protein [Vicinamibacterales bacterium]